MEVQLTTFDQMGVAGGDVFRLLGDGVFDVGMTVADYTVGDAPELEGLDVPLVATDAETAREMVEGRAPHGRGHHGGPLRRQAARHRAHTRRRSCSATRRSAGWPISRASRSAARAA